MDAPSMVQSSIGGTLIVRNLVSGDQMVINPTQNNESLEIVNKQQQSPASESETDRITSNLARNEDQSSRNSSISNNSSSSCNNNKMNINNNNNESNSATIDVDEPGLEEDSETNAQLKKDETKLPQCKIKRNYSCNNCNYFTQNPRRFLMHLRDTHGEKININECKLCLYASRHYQKLVRHMRMVHGSTEGINEPTQSRRPRTSLKLKRTSQLQEDPDLMIDEPHFINSVIDMQVPGDTGPRLEKCSMCSFTALSHDSLKAHEREDHAQTKFFRCSRCNYVTHIRARYSKHIKYHSMPMIKCHLCDFRTPYKWNLDRHMKNHGGQGPFKCSACTFSADIKQSLTVHETNHHIPPIGGHTASDLVPQLHDWPEDLSMSSSHNSQEDEEIPLDYTVTKSPDLSDNQGGETSNSDGSYRKKARPIPSLIPINETFNAFKNIPKANEASAMAAVDYLNEIYLKTIKSITMLFGNEEQQQNNNNNANQNLPLNSTAQDEDDSSKAINKKTLSIFEKLKEKINLGQIDDENLVCTCGYQAKSLSDIFMHQNICKIKSQSQETNNQEPERNCESVASSHSPTLSSIFSSTRCQYCRHRCKSTDDLLLHLKTCVEAQQQDGTGSDAGSDVKCEKLSTTGESSGSADEAPIDNPLEAPPSGINWIPNNATAAMQMAFMDQILSHNIEVVSENNNGGDVMVVDRPKKSGMGFPKKSPFVSMKKVFKCPHCSFWASTASRFHVHIVGHLNKKPFECSLCAYRSNWRWDITKHIRLKTVRDSNHKTARVLMNDETGRRNYTKYNKYITLMGVNDSDTNVKQSKVDDSILLQHHEQQARENGGTPTPMDISNPYLASALSFGKSSSHNTNDENHLSDNDSNNCNKKTHFKCKKCSFKSYDRDEVLGHVKQHYIDAGLLITSAAANANQKPLIQIPPPKLDIMSHFLEPTQSRIVSNLMQVMPDITIKTPPLFPLPNGETSITTAQSSDDPISVLNTDQITILTKNNNNNNQVASNSPRNKENVLQLGQLIGGGGGTSSTTTILNNHNNTNTNTIKINNNIINNFTPTNVTITSTSNTTTQGSSSAGLVQVQGSTTSTTTASTSTSASNNTSSNNNWRGPAPYRCGHCHQVSNWKHVIQRHCRLKHNGNISIEQLGKTNSNSGRVTSEDARSRRSRPQNTSTTNNNSNNNILTQSSNNNIFVNLNQSQIKPGSVNVLEDLLKRNIEQSQQTHQQKMDISISLEKKYKCQFCPYESNSKSQLQYHSSFHNQKSLIGDETEVFNCKYCTYTVSRRHLLLQHLKMHGNEAIEDAVDLTSEDNVNQESASKTLPSPRLLYFCRHCPARYLSKPEIDHHLSMHDADHSYKCRLCTYTASTESNMQAHYTVHTTYYQEKTKEFQNKYQTSVDHQMPRIEQEMQPSTSNETKEQSWIVIAPPPLPPNLLKSLHEQKMFGLLSLLTKCKFCGFNADTPDALQLHLVHHKRFSGKEFPYKCEHCDFSTTTIPLLTEHLKPHFLFIQNSRSDLMKINNNNNNNNNGPPSTANENGKSIAFYTNYDNLELKCVDLRKIKQENAMEVNEEFESDFIYNENSDLALKQKLLEMISNVSNKDKIIVRLD